MNEIKDIARVKFLPGKRAEWKRLTEQAMEVVRTKGQRHTPVRPSSACYAPGIAARFSLQRLRKRDCSVRLPPGQAARFIVFERDNSGDTILNHRYTSRRCATRTTRIVIRSSSMRATTR
jgi:hypothetical protein